MQRFFGVRVEELAASMSHAANFCDALFEACLVASEVVADQLTVPVAQEGSGMFAGTAGAEVIDDRCEAGELSGGVGPDVAAAGLRDAWSQHLYRRFVSVNDAVRKHGLGTPPPERIELKQVDAGNSIYSKSRSIYEN